MYLLLDAHGSIIGCLGAVNRCFMQGSRRLRGSILTDFFVDPLHRFAFPAMLLQREARRGELQQCDIVVGLPGQKAQQLFKRLGADRIFAAHSFVKILNWRHITHRYLPKAVGGVAGVALNGVDWLAGAVQTLTSCARGTWSCGPEETAEALEQIWDRSTTGIHVVGVRNACYLKWRFQQCPQLAPRLFIVRKRRGTEPLGYFVCSVERDGIDIHDFHFVDTDRWFCAGLRQLVRAARALERPRMSVELVVTPTLRRQLSRLHFSLRRSRSVFVLLGTAAPPDCDHLEFTHADCDV